MKTHGGYLRYSVTVAIFGALIILFQFSAFAAVPPQQKVTAPEGPSKKFDTAQKGPQSDLSGKSKLQQDPAAAFYNNDGGISSKKPNDPNGDGKLDDHDKAVLPAPIGVVPIDPKDQAVIDQVIGPITPELPASDPNGDGKLDDHDKAVLPAPIGVVPIDPVAPKLPASDPNGDGKLDDHDKAVLPAPIGVVPIDPKDQAVIDQVIGPITPELPASDPNGDRKITDQDRKVAERWVEREKTPSPKR